MRAESHPADPWQDVDAALEAAETHLSVLVAYMLPLRRETEDVRAALAELRAGRRLFADLREAERPYASWGRFRAAMEARDEEVRRLGVEAHREARP